MTINTNKLLDKVTPIEYVRLPENWVSEHVIILQVSSCKHFKHLGIRTGSYIGIDTSKRFSEGEPCAFLKIVKGKPRFRLSKIVLNGYECIGKLCLVVSFPMKEV